MSEVRSALALLLDKILSMPETRAVLEAHGIVSRAEDLIPLKEAAAAARVRPALVRLWFHRDAEFRASGAVEKRGRYWFADAAALRRWVEEHSGGRGPRGPAPRSAASPRRTAAEVLN